MMPHRSKTELWMQPQTLVTTESEKACEGQTKGRDVCAEREKIVPMERIVIYLPHGLRFWREAETFATTLSGARIASMAGFS